MSAEMTPPLVDAPPRESFLTAGYGVKSWLLTRDHKRIALLYLASITFFFFLGGLFALLIRLELLTPEGDLVQPETYNKLFTMHGIVMVFFFLIPSIPAVLGNFFIPMMIGAKDLAFPRLNLLSWYVYMIGGLFTLWAVVHGGVDTLHHGGEHVIGRLRPLICIDADRQLVRRACGLEHAEPRRSRCVKDDVDPGLILAERELLAPSGIAEGLGRYTSVLRDHRAVRADMLYAGTIASFELVDQRYVHTADESDSLRSANERGEGADEE